VELEESSAPYRGKSIVKQCIDRDSKRHNKRKGWIEKLEKDI